MAALTVIAPRVNTTQQIDFIRRTLNFGTQTTQMVGSLPVGAYITDVSSYVVTAFNAGTTNPLLVGVTPGGAELLAAADTTMATPGYYTNARGKGLLLTQAASAPNTTGDSEGGVGVYVNYTPTGTAPTTGQVVVVIAYAPAIDS